jgi:membrane associated rhomboid family serine protease
MPNTPDLAYPQPRIANVKALEMTTPASTLILLTMVVISGLALRSKPDWLLRGCFRPHWVGRTDSWLTALTSGFLHADFTHLLFNAISFWAFAFTLERAIGAVSLTLLYAWGLFASQMLTWVRHRGNRQYRTLGASGAINAVLFGFIVLFPGAKLMMFPVPVPIPAPWFALAYLGYSLWADRQRAQGINHTAHLGGAVAGAAYVIVTQPQVLVTWFR